MPDGQRPQPEWTRAASLAELRARGRLVARLDGPGGNFQIALFAGEGSDVWACDNRCPHEGYPLSEGKLASGCILTCNWHNWKFDLATGATLVGGDALRRFPVRIDGDDVLVDLAEPGPETVRAAALAGLKASFDGHEYDRMAREIARLEKAGGDPLDALRETIGWTFEHFEYGTTHAVAGAADWLALRDDCADGPGEKLTAALEAVGHFAWDSRLEPRYPFAEGSMPYDADALVAAIEHEDEATAVRLVRGGIEHGLGFDDFHPALARAALAHYQDFGHALIYVYKTGQLIGRLGGEETLEQLLMMMVRSLVYASREDLIPEFKAYAPALAAWPEGGTDVPAAETLARGSVRRVLDALVGGAKADPLVLYDACVAAASWQMARYDLAYQARTAGPVSENVGWLSFTHALTFANAVRKTCERLPELWPAGLLQLGCFLGRNAGFVDAEFDPAPFAVTDAAAFLAAEKRKLFDHGNPEFIVSCHLVKLATAAAEELAERPDAPWGAAAAQAINRFLNAPLKRKHALRTANQALAML